MLIQVINEVSETKETTMGLSTIYQDIIYLEIRRCRLFLYERFSGAIESRLEGQSTEFA